MKALKEHGIAWLVVAALGFTASNFLTVPWARAQDFQQFREVVQSYMAGQYRAELYALMAEIAKIKASGQTVPLFMRSREAELRALIARLERKAG